MGNVYISDTVNNKIRFVNQSTGIITTIAGTLSGGNSGDGGPATKAYLYGPTGVAIDKSMNVYIAGLVFPSSSFLPITNIYPHVYPHTALSPLLSSHTNIFTHTTLIPLISFLILPFPLSPTVISSLIGGDTDSVRVVSTATGIITTFIGFAYSPYRVALDVSGCPSIHSVKPLYQLITAYNTPNEHTLTTRPVNPQYQPTLLTHPVNPPNAKATCLSQRQAATASLWSVRGISTSMPQ